MCYSERLYKLIYVKIKTILTFKASCVVIVIPRSLADQNTLRHHFHPSRYPEIFKSSAQNQNLNKN